MFECFPSLCSRSHQIRATLTLMIALSAEIGFAQSDVVPPIPLAEASQSQTPQLNADNGYWIVSTHDSPQSFDRERPQFCPTVRHFDCDCSCRPRQTHFGTMCRALQPGVPICIYVHGSFVSARTVTYQSAVTSRWLKSASCGDPVQFIQFSWPSARPVLVATVNCDVNLLGRRAARNGWYLAEMIRHLPPESPICLIGHSHGTRVVASALHLMGGGRVQGVAHPHARLNGRRIRTVFAAAALRHDWLNPGERYGRALCSTECLINLRNRHDAALALYPLRHPFSGHSLGAAGFTPEDRQMLRGQSPKVQDYEVTPLIGHRHMWPRYIEYSRLAWLIRNYVYFPETREREAISSTDNPEATPEIYSPFNSVSSVDVSDSAPGDVYLPSL